MNIVLSKPGRRTPILSLRIHPLTDLSIEEIEGRAMSIAIDIDTNNNNFKFAKLDGDLEIDPQYKDIFISTLRRELSVIDVVLTDN